MKRIITAAVTATLVAGFMPATKANAADPAHVLIMLDASASNPMVVNTGHAKRVAADVVKMIGTLNMRDLVTISTLGEYDVTKNHTRDALINRKFPPNVALSTIGNMITTFPQHVNSNAGGVQQATSIIGSLEMMARRVSCNTHDVQIYVLSDGQENVQDLKTIPDALFSGCSKMTIVGLIGKNPSHTKQLAADWMRWCKAAGFTRCDYRS